MIKFSFPTFIFQTINFLITLYLIYRFVYRPLANYISKRQETIHNELEQARLEREKAEALRVEYEEKLRDAQKKAESIIEEAKHQAELERSQILDRANREAQALLLRAQNELLLERNHAIEKFKEEIVDVILNLTTKLIVTELNNRDDLKERILEEYIERVRSN